MAAEEAMRKADEAEAARKRAEEELERVRKETAAAARSEETASRIQSEAQDLVQEDPSRILQANPSPAQRMRLLSRITSTQHRGLARVATGRQVRRASCKPFPFSRVFSAFLRVIFLNTAFVVMECPIYLI